MTGGAAAAGSSPAAVAATLSTWATLADAIGSCTACAQLAEGRTRVVPGVCPVGADVLMVGEAPGVQEDATGVPFVGRAGSLLDSLLAEAGLPRDRVAVANVLKCHPPGNRKPRRTEITQCRPWLLRQIEVLDPVLIVTLGGTAAEWALGSGVKIATLRATAQIFKRWPVLCTYHPSAAIRFGPRGAPMVALRADLAEAARLAERLRAERATLTQGHRLGRAAPSATADSQ